MMSEQEKQYIVEQRAMGKNFAEIGRTLGRSEDSVRAVFNRITRRDAGTDISKEKCIPPGAKSPDRICRYCGRKFTAAPASAKQIFCTPSCRNAWCNEKKRRIPHRLVCEYCGSGFIAFGNPKKRFCSRQCYADSRREDGNA